MYCLPVMLLKSTFLEVFWGTEIKIKPLTLYDTDSYLFKSRTYIYGFPLEM